MISFEYKSQAPAYLFAVFALFASVFCAWNLPPFQGADELAHMNRAVMPTLGHWIGERGQTVLGEMSGSEVNLVIYDIDHAFSSLRFRPDVHVPEAAYAKTQEVKWDNRTTFGGFPNTAVYPPTFYLPQTAAIALGKALDMSVVRTLYLARIANALACIAIGTWALLLAGRASLPIFAVLMLPMSLGLYSTVTQDGMALVVTALGCAYIARALSAGYWMTLREVCVVAGCFALVGMSKPPYAILALVLLAVPVERVRWKVGATAAALGMSLGWTVWMSLTIQTNLYNSDAPDVGRQLAFLLADPRVVLSIAQNTLSVYGTVYTEQFVGILGWLDTRLPEQFYSLALWMLALSVLLSVSFHRGSHWKAVQVVVLPLVVVAAAGVFGAIYLSWTKVGSPTVDGVQGRYFLPLVVVAMLAVVGEKPLFQTWGKAGKLAALAVLAFPVLSVLVVERAIITRYYLG